MLPRGDVEAGAAAVAGRAPSRVASALKSFVSRQSSSRSRRHAMVHSKSGK
jgi:hypothetical protein